MTGSSESLEERPATPRHHPTYGVRMSDDEIKAVVFESLPDHDVVTIEQLPSGKSFNNRIYFIALSSQSTPVQHLLSNGVVLKLPGWNFGIDKIQNEVISMLLFEKHYPQIPVPRVLAWSEGGNFIQRIQRADDYLPSSGERLHTDLRIVSHRVSHRVSNPSRREDTRTWILTTCLPGLTLQPSRIEPHHATGVMQQLAEYMSQWREIPAPTQQMGNLRFVDSESEKLPSWDGTSTFLFGQRIAVHGLLIGAAPLAIHSSQEYYTTKLRGELAILKDNEVYAPNQTTLVPLIAEFLQNILPKIALFRRNHGHDTASVFTHYDLSPRNILVSPDSSGQLQVSGIVDFEFSGFFPAEEEFTNTCIAGEGDWPSQAWASFTEHLRAYNVEVPQGDMWNQACALVRIIDNIAPWRLREGGVQGEELEAALQQAKFEIEENCSVIKASLA